MRENAKLFHAVVEKAIRILKLDINLFPEVFEIYNNDILKVGIGYVYVKYCGVHKWYRLSDTINDIDDLYPAYDIYKELKYKIIKLINIDDSEYIYADDNINSNINELLNMSDEEFELMVKLS